MPRINENLEINVVDGKAVITIDLKHPGEASKSGKSRVIASSYGNIDIPGTDIKLGLNCYELNGKKKGFVVPDPIR